MKKEASAWNLFAIFYAFFVMTAIAGYSNVQIVYMLRDPEMFDFDLEFQGRAISNIFLVAMIAGIFFTTVAGYIYDIFLRKWPLFFTGILAATMLFACPYTAPSLVGLAIVRSVI